MDRLPRKFDTARDMVPKPTVEKDETARIGVRTADLYPRFSLFGFLSLQSTEGGDLFDGFGGASPKVGAQGEKESVSAAIAA